MNISRINDVDFCDNVSLIFGIWRGKYQFGLLDPKTLVCVFCGKSKTGWFPTKTFERLVKESPHLIPGIFLVSQ